MEIIQQMNAKQENFSVFPLFPTMEEKVKSEFDNLVSSSSISIKNVSSSFLNQPIRQFFIKGAYNAAVTGKYVNKDMVKYTLSRGCRYLDFEVFPIDKTLQVSYSTDPLFEMIDTEDSIALYDILKTVIVHGFSSTCPNMNDPLFIHLRVKSNVPQIYKMAASVIQATIGPKLYKGAVTLSTTLGDIMGKIVLIMDRTVEPNYRSLSTCPTTQEVTACYDLVNYVNMESGTTNLFMHKYADLLPQEGIEINVLTDKCSICTDLKDLRLVLPDVEYNKKNNVVVDDFITKHGCQIVPMKFYSVDGGLRDYEKLFDFHKSAFVPMSRAIEYVRNKKVPQY